MFYSRSVRTFHYVYKIVVSYLLVGYNVVVVVFTLKTVLTSILYLLTLQGKETNFRGHKLTQNKVQKKQNKKTQRKSQHFTCEKNM